jgi:hypothetical protein
VCKKSLLIERKTTQTEGREMEGRQKSSSGQLWFWRAEGSTLGQQDAWIFFSSHPWPPQSRHAAVFETDGHCWPEEHRVEQQIGSLKSILSPQAKSSLAEETNKCKACQICLGSEEDIKEKCVEVASEPVF